MTTYVMKINIMDIVGKWTGQNFKQSQTKVLVTIDSGGIATEAFLKPIRTAVKRSCQCNHTLAG